MVLWTAGFVLLTLVINAPLLPMVLRLTGLNKGVVSMLLYNSPKTLILALQFSLLLSSYCFDCLKHPLCLKFGTDAKSACVRACVCVRACARACVRACVCVCVCVRDTCLFATWHVCCYIAYLLYICICSLVGQMLTSRERLALSQKSLSQKTASGTCSFQFRFCISYFSIS